jgi:hypothetical protein
MTGLSLEMHTSHSTPGCLDPHSSLSSSVNVAKYQKGVYHLGVKVFNALPSDIKTEFNNPKKFKVVLQKFLCEKSFYSLDEYFDLQKC